MPNCGSQIYLCDMPIRFDTYKGCSHGCKYCFVQKKNTLEVETGEGVEALRNFIEGRRAREMNWCDWNIPLHWGGMSDPFQPIEKEKRISYECLKLFAETGYPFVVSTKGKLIVEPEYLDLLRKCNCAVQISMVCSKYDKMELGAPTFEERMEMLRTLSKYVPRVIVRAQPYLHECKSDLLENMQKFKDAGVYGVIVEGMKFFGKKVKGTVKVGGDWVYPYDLILSDFLELKEEAHRVGLKIFAGENRIRKYGDSLTCCGVGDMFEVNTWNLNHMLNGDKTEPTEKMQEKGTAGCFQSLMQDSRRTQKTYYDKISFAGCMVGYYKDRKDTIDVIMGVKKR